MTRKKTWIIVLLAVLAAIFLALLFLPGDSEAIRVGLIGPMSGAAASWGNNVHAGTMLAIQETNAKGGIDGRKLELYIEDGECSEKAVNAMQKLINVNQVDVIIGPTCSSEAGPALPIAKEKNIPVLLATPTAPELTSIGDNIFRVTPSDSIQGKEIANFVANRLNKKKIAFIYTKNAWGEGIKNIFIPSYQGFGGQVVYESSVLESERDFKTELTKVKESDAEVLLLIAYPDALVPAMKQYHELGINIPVMGGDISNGEEVVKSGSANDLIYIIPKINTPDEFKAKIKSIQAFSNLEVNLAAPLGYDAAMVMFRAIDKAGTDPEEIKQALRSTSYSGVSNPIIEFDEVGDIKSASFEFKVIKDKGSLPYQ